MKGLGVLLAVLAGAILEMRLLEHWHHIGLRQRAPYLQQSVNYLVYVGLPCVVAWWIARRRFGPRPARALEGLLGVGLVAGLVLGTAWLLPWKRTVPPLALGALVVAAALAAAWAFPRARAARVAWRVALAVVVVGIVGLEPSVGRYTGWRAGGREVVGPDVLFVVFDTLREDGLSCYGAEAPTSPVVDRIAARGVRFTNAYAQSSWTLPTTATLHTGRHPSSHGATAKGRGIGAAATTLAERFRAAGYHTAAFSENHLVTPRYGFGQGFDRFWASWIPRVNRVSVLHELFERTGLPPVLDARTRAHPKRATEPSDVTWDARVTVDHALRYLDGLRGSVFLYLHFMGPHGPYGPPEFLLDDPPAVRVADHPRDMGGAYPIGPAGQPVSDAERDVMRRLYLADIAYVDREVGRVLEALERTGRAANTIVLVTSDHGEEFYEHEGWNHGGSVFGEVVRVPLVLAPPNGIAPARVESTLVSQLDVLPTLLELAGLPRDEGNEGESLAGALSGEGPAARPVLVEGCANRPPGAGMDALVATPWKLVSVAYGGRDTLLLFDVDADPGERHDVGAAHAALRDSLAAELAGRRMAAAGRSSDARRVPMDEESLDALRNLGYIR